MAFLLKFLPIFLVYIISFSNQINCKIPNEKFIMVETISDKKSAIKVGDKLECVVNKMQPLGHVNDIHVFTEAKTGYTFFAAPEKKCFSFQVRAKYYPHIILNETPYVVRGKKLEVILDYETYHQSVIRTKDDKHASVYGKYGLVNEKELKPFWVRWMNNKLEVGHGGDDKPFLSHSTPDIKYVKYIGISASPNAEWIINREPKCGRVADKLTEDIEVEAACKTIK